MEEVRAMPRPSNPRETRSPLNLNGRRFVLTSPDADCGQQLEWQTEATAEAVILRLSGEIDLATAPRVSSTLRILAEDGHNVIIDLNRLRYIDSTGFKAILDANSMFVKKAQRLVLSAPSDVIRKIIDIIEFDKIVPVFASADAAKESIRSNRAPSPQSKSGR